MDVRINARQCDTRDIGARLFQQRNRVACDVVRRASPPGTEQRGIRHLRDQPRIGHRQGRRRIHYHECEVLPQRLQQ